MKSPPNKRRLWTGIGVAATAVVVVATAAFAVDGSDGIDFQPAQISPRVSTASGPAPETTAPGRAVAAVLPEGEAVAAVQMVRNDVSRYDVVDARRADGSGYEVNVWYRFAPQELADMGVRPVETEQGRFWPASEDPTLRSIYFQARSGVAMRVAHYSAGPDDRVTHQSLIAFAERLAGELTNANGGMRLGGR